MKTNPHSMTSEVFQNIIDTLPVMLFWTNTHHLFLGSNLSYAKKCGFSSTDELIGKSILETNETFSTKNKEIDDLYKEHSKIMRSGQGQVLEYTDSLFDQSNNQKEKTYLSYKYPLRDGTNAVIGLIGIFLETTELKKAESESQNKSEFIANMAHDFRNPIAAMAGMIRLMLSEVDDGQTYLNQSLQPTRKQLADKLDMFCTEFKQNNELLIGATNELLSLCSNILETANLEIGKAVRKASEFDLHALIQRHVDLLQPMAKNKNLTLSSEIAQRVPRYVTGIRTYTDSVILNLISNAIKFTHSGFVKIFADLYNDARQILKTGDTIELILIIEDSGMGIPQNKFNTIFEHFSRLTPSTDGNYNGSGLGLYTVKQYLKVLKGKIQVESKLKEGSKFIVRIPFTVSNTNTCKELV